MNEWKRAHFSKFKTNLKMKLSKQQTNLKFWECESAQNVQKVQSKWVEKTWKVMENISHGKSVY